jgi:hypothetical protein
MLPQCLPTLIDRFCSPVKTRLSILYQGLQNNLAFFPPYIASYMRSEYNSYRKTT